MGGGGIHANNKEQVSECELRNRDFCFVDGGGVLDEVDLLPFAGGYAFDLII